MGFSWNGKERENMKNTFKIGSWPSSFKCAVDTHLVASPKIQFKNGKNRENEPILPISPLMLSQNRKDGSSFWQATFNAINLLLGVGVLSLPFAFRSSGWIVGGILLLAFSLMTNFTGKLLADCMDYQSYIKTYPDIGEAAFGHRGRTFISFVFFMELFTACTMFLILVGDNLHQLLPQYSIETLTLLSFLVILPTSWTSHLSLLSYFSIVGIFSSVYLLGILLFVGITNGQDGSLMNPATTEWIAEQDRLPLSIGLIMVGYAGHAVFPSIYYSMEDKTKYSKMLDITYGTVCLVYGIIAVAGYLMYGTSTQKEITFNLLITNNNWIVKSVICMVALNPATKFSLTMNPVALSIEELLLPHDFVVSQGMKQTFIRGAIRTLLSSAALMTALYVPYFARITSFLGAMSAMLVSAIFPCVCYLKLYGATRDALKYDICFVIIISATVLGIIGTLAAFLSPAN